jgi:hypothetical protein
VPERGALLAYARCWYMRARLQSHAVVRRLPHISRAS